MNPLEHATSCQHPEWVSAQDLRSISGPGRVCMLDPATVLQTADSLNSHTGGNMIWHKMLKKDKGVLEKKAPTDQDGRQEPRWT